MEEKNKIEATRILIFTPSLKLSQYLTELLKGEGYTIYSCSDVDNVMDEVHHKDIHLLLMDFDTPSILDICKEIRINFTFYNMPIIVLVDKEKTLDKIKAIYAGADDYIEKPPEASELLVRIRANFWRSQRNIDANPLTKLPGNASILKELERRLNAHQKFCVAYADLDRFKEYNDYYGFSWGDRVIKHTASLISNVLYELGTSTDFLGHIGGDDFVFICDIECMVDICENIIKKFDEMIGFFYREEDRNNGYIITKNRAGKVEKISLMSISIGVANTAKRKFNHIAEIINTVVELKRYGKTFAKSIYIVDRRS